MGVQAVFFFLVWMFFVKEKKDQNRVYVFDVSIGYFHNSKLNFNGLKTLYIRGRPLLCMRFQILCCGCLHVCPMRKIFFAAFYFATRLRNIIN